MIKLNMFYTLKNLKEALRQGLVFKKFINFNQKAWLKPYIDMNTKVREKAKYNFVKDFFKFMNNAIFGKPMEDVTKQKH